MTNDKSDDVEREHMPANPTEMRLASYLAQRSEIGLIRMLSNLAFEPQDPFKPDAQRTFRKSFIIAVLFSALFAGWFIWFNVIR
jgi:hypothetical protein